MRGSLGVERENRGAENRRENAEKKKKKKKKKKTKGERRRREGEEKEEGLSLPIGVCFEEKNEAAIYRRMERKKKTMKEIKKENEEKWNLSGR